MRQKIDNIIHITAKFAKIEKFFLFYIHEYRFLTSRTHIHEH